MSGVLLLTGLQWLSLRPRALITVRTPTQLSTNQKTLVMKYVMKYEHDDDDNNTMNYFYTSGNNIGTST
jgi:hypothetical protein